MQIPTSNLVSVHNPDIPTHNLDLADRSLLSTTIPTAYGILLETRCWLISVSRSSVAYLYSLLPDQLSLLTARYLPQGLWYF